MSRVVDFINVMRYKPMLEGKEIYNTPNNS